MATLGQDILTTAVEGGIGYWFQIHESKRTDELDWVEVEGHELSDDESGFDGPRHTIKSTQLEKAARKIVTGEVQLRSDLRDAVTRMMRDRDASYIDADSADCIVQVAVFGDTKYG